MAGPFVKVPQLLHTEQQHAAPLAAPRMDALRRGRVRRRVRFRNSTAHGSGDFRQVQPTITGV